ncbi:hypothetical protein GCM10022278_38130 [Allohahella marinimesophila]|uniref:Uncharacterized protein n=1 Tax=Allohahella marinimesophila TaxID=1054972 RepID=A0ABP7QAD7_9GAMM
MKNGTIEVERMGQLLSPTRRVLQVRARQLGIQPLNSNGNPYNTRQLGNQIIKVLLDG